MRMDKKEKLIAAVLSVLVPGLLGLGYYLTHHGINFPIANPYDNAFGLSELEKRVDAIEAER